MTTEELEAIILALIKANDACCGCNITNRLTPDQEAFVDDLERRSS